MGIAERHLADIAHDPGAFEAFYRRHVANVSRFIARRVDDPYTAAGLTAERRRAHREMAATCRVAGRRLLDAADIARLEERIDAESSARRVYQALADVPEATRRLLELVAVDGLPDAEAAAALGMSPIAARVRLHRVRKQLRDVLTDLNPLPSTGGTPHEFA